VSFNITHFELKIMTTDNGCMKCKCEIKGGGKKLKIIA